MSGAKKEILSLQVNSRVAINYNNDGQDKIAEGRVDRIGECKEKGSAYVVIEGSKRWWTINESTVRKITVQ